MSKLLENLSKEQKESGVSIISLINNFELADELISLIKSKGYEVTTDTEKFDNNKIDPRLIILVNKRV
jgi:hypothetical protein